LAGLIGTKLHIKVGKDPGKLQKESA
jgi:hypothetical protein